MKFVLQSTHFFTKFADVLLELLHVLPDLFHLLPHFLCAQRSNGKSKAEQNRMISRLGIFTLIS